jgi:pimeloyl-ACP methyl ester carboxylesterase
MRHPLLFAQVSLALDPGVLYAPPHRARRLLFSTDPRVDVDRHAARLGAESFRALFDMTFDRPRVEWIRRRNRPMLVLGASDDAILSRRDVEETARAYGVSAVIFPQMGHAMMLDARWRDVAAHIRNWLETTVMPAVRISPANPETRSTPPLPISPAANRH